MVGITPGVDVLAPPLSIVFFGLPILHKHLSNPMTRRGLRYVISGFTVLKDSKNDIPAEQMMELNIKHDDLLLQAERLEEQGKTWLGSLIMNAEAHRFKYHAKKFYFLAFKVSQASQKADILKNSPHMSSPGCARPATPASSDTSPDQSQEQPTFHFTSSAQRDEFLAQVTAPNNDSADFADPSTSTSSEAVPKTVFVVLDPLEEDPAPESQPASPPEASYERKEYHGYYIFPEGDDAVSFVSR